jgi:hypothetical protein
MITASQYECDFNQSLIALLPVSILFYVSMGMYVRSKTAGSLMQLFGAGALVIVVLTHVCEALHFFPWMHWGLEHSVGHYLDLWSAILGLTLVPFGYLLNLLAGRSI